MPAHRLWGLAGEAYSLSDAGGPPADRSAANPRAGSNGSRSQSWQFRWIDSPIRKNPCDPVAPAAEGLAGFEQTSQRDAVIVSDQARPSNGRGKGIRQPTQVQKCLEDQEVCPAASGGT